MTQPHLYMLDADGSPVGTLDLLEWARWFETFDRVIASTEIDALRISTVFLGIDHGFGFSDSAPVLFETMIFGAPVETTIMGMTRTMCPALEYQERYCTRDQAIAGHTRAVDAVLAKRVQLRRDEASK